jgi:hypothetical protein
MCRSATLAARRRTTYSSRFASATSFHSTNIRSRVLCVQGAEFVQPLPESSNHLSSVFVYHRPSRTVHIDDTIMFSSKGNLLLKLLIYRNGNMDFHPSIRNVGLYPSSDGPLMFRDWMRQLLHDWPLENMCCAHTGVKRGNAHAALTVLVDRYDTLFVRMSEKNRKRKDNAANPQHVDGLVDDNRDDDDDDENECG